MRISNLPVVLAFLLAPALAMAQQAAAGDDLAARVDLSALRCVSVQHDQTVKTLDTFAREAIYAITGRSSLDGQDALYTLLDMSFRPQRYVDRDIIKIKYLPLRAEFQGLDWIDVSEAQRILKEGTVSLTFLQKPEVGELFQKIQADSVQKSKAINQVMSAAGALHEICELDRGSIPAAIIAPGPAGASQPASEATWHRLAEIIGAAPSFAKLLETHGVTPPAAPAGYENSGALLDNIIESMQALDQGWEAGDAAKVNAAAASLAQSLPLVNPQVYPSQLKRQAEVTYNHLAKLTIPGAAFYLIAFVLLLMSAQAGVSRLRLWGLRFMAVALLIHTAGIAIRWWLVGDVFPPIKNEFESVMFSAWFGATIGLILELRIGRGFIGAAASFVGALALIAIFAAPYVTGVQIGGEIGQVQGILMSYWLYIHVTMVTASYAMIAMGFVLSTWWLVRYYRRHGTLSRSAMTANAPPAPSGSAGPMHATPALKGGSAAALSVGQTLAMMLFMHASPAARSGSATATAKAAALPAAADSRDFLNTLDQCNLVVLQLAFWMLGAGVMLGAIWADQSWGRPWGWDPKETFALVTWMVYLIIVHVRVVTTNKAWWTAVLACAGFFVMLFNWIGVNFFLMGLHSYA